MSEDPFRELRLAMVERQLVRRGIRDERVLAAMRAVPRHRFVPEKLAQFAYDDRPLDIGLRQTISQPYIVALMTELLEPRHTDRVLEVGTGSGYQAAVLASLVSEVFSVERLPELADAARERLTALGYGNVVVRWSDGTCGWAGAAPYDGVVVTAAAPHMPSALEEQVAEGGRLVCPVGTRRAQRLVKLVREGGRFREIDSIDCVFVPLIGEDGWEE